MTSAEDVAPLTDEELARWHALLDNQPRVSINLEEVRPALVGMLATITDLQGKLGTLVDDYRAVHMTNDYLEKENTDLKARAEAAEAESARLSRELEFSHETNWALQAQQESTVKMRQALVPLSRLEIPKRPQGNAGAYSIRHEWIEAARSALNPQRGCRPLVCISLGE